MDNTLKDFDELVSQRKELKFWKSLENQKTFLFKKKYRLSCDLPKIIYIAYNYAENIMRSRNYYTAPPFFLEAVKNQIDKELEGIINRAYESEIKKLDEAICSCKKQILKELECDDAGETNNA